MKRLICYFRTILEINTVLKVFWAFNAIYVAHDYYEQKSYIRGEKLYEPLKCKTCGHIDIAWRQLR
ncbi:MAG: hypothetical protein AABY22_23620 [Nanoarchaeota archaeon]